MGSGLVAGGPVRWPRASRWAGWLAEAFLGVKAERKGPEEIANPLTAEDASTVPATAPRLLSPRSPTSPSNPRTLCPRS